MDAAVEPAEVEVLGVADAGELLTLQRAAYVTEAIAHEDPQPPPLTQTLDELREELCLPDVVALGVREAARLVGAVRLRKAGEVMELGRLTVAPDRQGRGIGTALLRRAEEVFPDVREIRLFTGERSDGNIRLYVRHGYLETERTPAGSYQLVHFVKLLG